MKDPHYTAYGLAKGISGHIIEVGLGEGQIIKALVEEIRVKTVTNYERDIVVADKFQTDNPGFHVKHTMVKEDFMTATLPAKKFDIAILDTLDQKEDYGKAKDIVQKLKTRMKKGGSIMIEYQADIPEERDLRKHLESEFGKMETEFINTGIKATSRHVCYYTVS